MPNSCGLSRLSAQVETENGKGVANMGYWINRDCSDRTADSRVTAKHLSRWYRRLGSTCFIVDAVNG